MVCRISSLFLLSCLPIHLFADCYKVDTGDCVDFAGMWGYEERDCSGDGDCSNNLGDWECPFVGDAYNYQPNTLNHYHDDPLAAPGTGSDALSIVQGAVCVKRRPCEGCSSTVDPVTGLRGCIFKAGTVWTSFLWGSNITYSGNACPPAP